MNAHALERRLLEIDLEQARVERDQAARHCDRCVALGASVAVEEREEAQAALALRELDVEAAGVRLQLFDGG